MPRAEILSQGEEVVSGEIADTNAAWLAERLTALGFTVARHTAVGDRLEEIAQTLAEVGRRVDLCLCTGGLGPTQDDLTAAAAANAFDCPLELDRAALEQIRSFYRRRGRELSPSNEKQAWLPRGALRLDNDWGTAPGFALSAAGAWMTFLPGVPEEMREMFRHRVEPLLRERFPIRPGRRVTLRTTGVGESGVQERIGQFRRPGIELSFRVFAPEVQLKLLCRPEVEEPEIRAAVAELHARIGDAVFAVEGLGDEGGSLAEVVGRLLLRRNATLAVAESCTGGLLASLCTRIAGASAWFLEGAVSYSNAAKTRLVGVDPRLIEVHGAVSEPVARAMARGARERSGASFALSTTGIAGPTGGSAQKPVGTVYLGLSGPVGERHRLLRLGGERWRIQIDSAAAALDLLRRELLAHG